MNLEAAKINDTRTWILARISMAACIATTGALLVVSQNLPQEDGWSNKPIVQAVEAPNH
ncbi:MAG TPA: hypothetical protein PKD49_00330 [Hyphomicrobium sp.]|nr:hypothetical protein [Hyphomicrobium sp.]